MPCDDTRPLVSATAKPASAKPCQPNAMPTGTKPKPCWKNGVLAMTPTFRSMPHWPENALCFSGSVAKIVKLEHAWRRLDGRNDDGFRSEEHTSELQSRFDLVCRLLL